MCIILTDEEINLLAREWEIYDKNSTYSRIISNKC